MSESDDVAAYLRGLSFVTKKRQGDGSDSDVSLSLSSVLQKPVKQNANRFARNQPQVPTPSIEVSRRAEKKIVKPNNKLASPEPTHHGHGSDNNVETALQKFMKLDQKYSKDVEKIVDEEESTTSSEVDNHSSSVRAPSPVPKLEKRVSFSVAELRVNSPDEDDKSSPRDERREPEVTPKRDPIRRFSLSMEEIRSVEELETSGSEGSKESAVLASQNKVSTSPKPPKPAEMPIGGPVRSLVVDLPSYAEEPPNTSRKSSKKPESEVVETLRRVPKAVDDHSTQTSVVVDVHHTVTVAPRADVRRYLDPDVARGKRILYFVVQSLP
jgi:hypothetical protein